MGRAKRSPKKAGATRREFFRRAGGTTLAVGSLALLGGCGGNGSADPVPSSPGAGPFRHGVASGDPLADRVILWTRVTPTDDALPGSGRGAAAKVEWQIAADGAFTDVIRRGDVTTDAATDHTVKVDVDGLRADTGYWYRFTTSGVTSPVGRTRTAPAPGADIDALRLGVVSCSNWEGGFFSVFGHL